MKVLIADKFEQSGVDALQRCGCEIALKPDLKDDALRDAIADSGCKVLIVRSTRVTEPMLDAGGTLELIVRAGAGVNTIDLEAASRASILVANCPGKNAIAVAELTFSLILALDRRIVENVNDLRGGTWNKKAYAQAAGLKGRTLGIIGMGEIGKAVALRAHAFGMHIAAWSRSLSDELAADYGAVRCASPRQVAERCDILSIHVAAGAETKGLINAEVLNALPPGAHVINTARHDVLDYAALAKAVRERGLRVGLDVYPDEPPTGEAEFSPPIMQAGATVYGTHHIGASTDQAQQAIAAETVRIVRTFAETGRVINCVNVRQPAAHLWCLTVRHLNHPGVLAHVLGQLSHAGVNVEEMDNIIMEGAEAACAHIHVDAQPTADTLDAIRAGSDSVLGVSMTRG